MLSGPLSHPTGRRRFAFCVSTLTVLVCLSVIGGWQFDLPLLKSLIPGYVTMKFNTAFGLLVLSVTQVALIGTPSERQKWLVRLCTAVCFMIAAATLAEYSFGFDLGIDQLIYKDLDHFGRMYPPGRLAPVTAVSFVLTTLGIAAIWLQRRPRYRLGQVCFLITGLISFQALTSYILGVQTSFGIAAHTRIAVHTASALILLNFGFLLLSSPHGYMRVVLARTDAGRMTRHLLTATIFVPPFFNWMVQVAEGREILEHDFGVLIRVVGSVVFLTTTVWLNAERLHVSERRRRRAYRSFMKVQAAKARLEENRRQALAATEMKSQFLANMSHEIRTPLNGIIGITRLLNETSLDPTQRNYLEVMSQSSHTLLTLVSGILDLAKIEAGKLQLEIVDFSLPALVEEVMAVIEPLARGRSLFLTTEIDSDLPSTFQGDASRIRQVMFNLLSNAVKFAERGEIRLRIAKTSAIDGVYQLAIEVVDQGIGIDDATKGLLFQSFAQGDGSISRKYGGTGLGLAISKQPVELMGGTIGAESVKGIGSRFYFSVALQESSAELAAAARLRPIEKVLSAHVLVAEDNVVNQKIMLAILKHLGCSAKVAKNGEEALRALKSEHFDIILMDGQMPKMDGFETTERIRRGEAGANNVKIPIIATNASVVVGEPERCFRAGMNEFVSKPVVVEELCEKMAKHLVQVEDVLESATLQRIKDLAARGNKTLLHDLIALFSEETPSMIDRLKAQVEAKNFVDAAKTAHALKSASANMGAKRVSSLSARIESLHDLDELPGLAESLIREYGLALDALKKHISS